MKYNLFTFFENLKNDLKYIDLHERLTTDAGIITRLAITSKDGTTVNIYSAGLYYIFESNEYKNEGFQDAYIKGFEDGKQFINEKINKALNGFYRSNSKEYINELQYAYFFNAENYILGYKNKAECFPIVFYIEEIEKTGFAAGVVSTIDLMAKENPMLFAGFYDIYTDQPQQLKINNTDEIKKEHPKHDPNLWNNDCFELFKYLYDCYYKTTNRQLSNVWFYLKESGSNRYILKATKNQYKDFIFKNYQIKITNFDKAQAKWEDKEYNTINDHRINFEDTLK